MKSIESEARVTLLIVKQSYIRTLVCAPGLGLEKIH